ncbi:MAG: DeoR/GlpR family DNA-binding transcription regulator [Proteobacteria bacterium]|nr:DeoR/GlpR family DNA-binding transcription regulator [Pseudomonadota bacterium]MBU6425674.1 DeoR/GlpR family DNA-binding transcription regulator [Rhodospirillales bacterium]
MRQEKRERHTKILTALSGASSVRVAELARQFGVSTETIRRDFDELTRGGQLSRTYGGAVRTLDSRHHGEAERQSILLAERQRIAKATVDEVADARILLIGCGATAVQVARQVAARLKDITVVTHSFAVAAAVGVNHLVEVMMIPGLYHPAKASTTGGHAIVFLQSLYADYVILGASGVTQDGPGDSLPEIAAVNTAMMSRAARCVIAADQSKFNLSSSTRYADWPQVSTFVTDAAPPAELQKTLESNRVKLLVA